MSKIIFEVEMKDIVDNMLILKQRIIHRWHLEFLHS